VVSIKLFGGLEHYIDGYDRQNGYSFEVADYKTLRYFLEKKEVPTKLISVVLAGDKSVSLDYQIKDRDRIRVFPQMGSD